MIPESRRARRADLSRGGRGGERARAEGRVAGTRWGPVGAQEPGAGVKSRFSGRRDRTGLASSTTKTNSPPALLDFQITGRDDDGARTHHHRVAATQHVHSENPLGNGATLGKAIDE